MKNITFLIFCFFITITLSSQSDSINVDGGFLYVYPKTEDSKPTGRLELSVPITKDSELNSILKKYKVKVYELAFPGAKSECLRNAHQIILEDGKKAHLLKNHLNKSSKFSRIEFEPFYYTTETKVDVFITTSCTPPVVNDPYQDWGLDAINAPCAWAISAGSSLFPIGIVDTEFDPQGLVVDLAGKVNSVWVHPNMANSYPACYHGTNVTSMAVSKTNNSSGMRSVAYNSVVAGYVPINSPRSQGGCNIAPWPAVWQAYIEGRKIINLSASGLGFSGGTGSCSTVQACVSEMTANGTILVLAGGAPRSQSSSISHADVANIPGVIVVSGLAPGPLFEPADAPGNQYIDICAPSRDVYRTGWDNNTALSSGTSLAAPIVSGVVSQILSINSCLSSAEVENIIKITGKPIPDADEPGETFYGKVGAGRIDVLDALKFAAGQYDPITSSVTWDKPLMLNGNLVINSEGTLTLTSTLRVNGNYKITVNPGGKLIVDGGKITKACQNSWGGIEVWGYTNLSQSPATNQGVVELKNGASIEYAVNAVSVQNGGIVQASNTTFLNNRRSIEFVNYPAADNVSYFSNSTFTIDNNYNQTDFYKHITMWQVWGVSITGSYFKNLNTLLTNGAGDGIYTVDAGFSVSNTTFEGFQYGINFTKSSTTRNVSVSYSTFTNNSAGVRDGIMPSAAVQYNTFNIGGKPFGSGSTFLNHGLILEGATGFFVNNNVFNNTGVATNNSIGVLVKNAGTANNYVQNNEFFGLHYAELSNGTNRNSTGSTGLRLYCNYHENSTYDITLPNESNAAYGIATTQGSSLSPAGNSFSRKTSPVYSDYNNQAWVSNAKLITYYYSTPDGFYAFPGSRYKVTAASNSANAQCTVGPFQGGSMMMLAGNFAGAQSEYQNLSAKLAAKIDGGNTGQLTAAVRSAKVGEGEALSNALLALSPYLSGQVLAAVLDRTDLFSRAQQLALLEANPDGVNENVVSQRLAKGETPFNSEELAWLDTKRSQATQRSGNHGHTQRQYQDGKRFHNWWCLGMLSADKLGKIYITYLKSGG